MPGGAVQEERSFAVRHGAARTPEGDERVLMGWLLGAGWIIPGLLGIVSTIVPHYPGIDEREIVITSSLAVLIGIANVALRRRIPPIAYRGLVLLGLAAVTFGLSRSGDPRTDTELFYVYPLLFAFYFFRWWEAGLMWALAVVLCAVTVSDLEPDAPLAGILIFAVVVGVDGAVIGLLRDRNRRLVGALGRSAESDPLTRLLNRRGFQVQAERILEKAGERELSCSLIIADLDDFKRVNDRLGHLGGDMTLERVAKVMAKVRRSEEITARMGGEEFAVVLPGAGGGQAMRIAERMRVAIADEMAESPAPITASIGIACLPEHGATLEDLMRSADFALYAAKDAGKNRCVLYDQGLREGAAVPDRLPPSWTPTRPA